MKPNIRVVVAAFVAGCVIALGLALAQRVHAEPRPDQCYDLFDLHAGTAEANRQTWFNHLDARGYARYWIACVEHWGTLQWECLDELWTEESSWRHDIHGRIPQAMPETKIATHGPDWRTNPRVQVRWGVDYIADRYGLPTNTPRRCHAGY